MRPDFVSSLKQKRPFRENRAVELGGEPVCKKVWSVAMAFFSVHVATSHAAKMVQPVISANRTLVASTYAGEVDTLTDADRSVIAHIPSASDIQAAPGLKVPYTLPHPVQSEKNRKAIRKTGPATPQQGPGKSSTFKRISNVARSRSGRLVEACPEETAFENLLVKLNLRGRCNAVANRKPRSMHHWPM